MKFIILKGTKKSLFSYDYGKSKEMTGHIYDITSQFFLRVIQFERL